MAPNSPLHAHRLPLQQYHHQQRVQLAIQYRLDASRSPAEPPEPPAPNPSNPSMRPPTLAPTAESLGGSAIPPRPPADVKPRLTKEQHEILEKHFKEHNKPTTATKRDYASRLGVPIEKINVSRPGIAVPNAGYANSRPELVPEPPCQVEAGGQAAPAPGASRDSERPLHALHYGSSRRAPNHDHAAYGRLIAAVWHEFTASNDAVSVGCIHQFDTVSRKRDYECTKWAHSADAPYTTAVLRPVFP